MEANVDGWIDAGGESLSNVDRDAPLIQAAALHPDDLDPDIDPRDDLDGHVNARWRARTAIPADRGCWDSFSIVAEATLRSQREIADQASRLHVRLSSVDSGCVADDDMQASCVVRRGNPIEESSQAGRGSCLASAGSPASLEMTEQAQVHVRHARQQAGSDSSGTARIVGSLWRSGMDLDARDRAGCEAMAGDVAAIDAIASRSELAAFIDRVHARGESLLWSIDVVRDVANPTLALMRVSPARGPLGRADLLGNTRVEARRRRLCAAYFAGLLRRSGCAIKFAHQQSRHAFDLEQALASAMPNEAMRDVAALHRTIAWQRGLQDVRPLSLDACLVSAGVSPPTVVSLPMPTFHATVAGLLAERPITQWQAWLRVRLLDAAAPELSSDLRGWHHRFHGRALRGVRAEPRLWKQVLGAIDRVAPDAMGQLYVSRHVSPETAPRMRELFESLRGALRVRLAAADWLGTVARARAIAKVDAMRAKLVAPDRWADWRDVDLAASSFHASTRLLRAHELRRRLRSMECGELKQENGGASHADDWSMPAHRVNARYDPQRNCIEVPAGILQPPFFDPQASRASQFGAIGAVMAHEMSHGFDDQGRRFDADGRLGDGWPAPDVAAFDRRADAVAEWFDGMPDGMGGRVDGRRTLGENLADITGLAVAWDAYRSDCAVEPASGGHVDAEEASDAQSVAPLDADANLEADANTQVDSCADADADARSFFIAWAVMWRQLLTRAEAERGARLDHHAPAALRANVAAIAQQGFWRSFGSRGTDSVDDVPSVW